MRYKTDIATEDELRRWNQIVSRCPYSEALHTLEWRNGLTESFNQLRPLYLIIKKSGQTSGSAEDNIVGAVPCFAFHPIPFVRTLLSMPWTLPGGPLIFPEADVSEAALSVTGKLDEIAQDAGTSSFLEKGLCRYFETTLNLPPYCDRDIADNIISAGYIRASTQFTHILRTETAYDEIWKAYNKRIRGAVRKSRKMGVIVRETEDEAEMIEFYRLYLAIMKRFSSTPKPYQLLRYLQTSSIARLVVAQADDRIIGGLLFLHFNSAVRLWCEASDPDFLSYRPNNAIIDYIIRWACEHGYPCVDFGASPPGSKGLIAFKEEWRAQKAWFHTFTKLHSSWKKRVWNVSEPALRRVYAAIQRFKLRSV